MKLIKSSYEILEQEPGLEGIYKAIERAGRTCYKSQDKITEDSAHKFVDMLISRGHLSPLEHGAVYITERWKKVQFDMQPCSKWDNNPYTKIVTKRIENEVWRYITTNYRVLVENDWLDDLKYICAPTEHHDRRVGVRVNCSIGISREWNRHRTLSICEQSTRYCNYSKDRFNNELTFVIPSWAPSLQPGLLEYFPFEITNNEVLFMDSCHQAEIHYLNMIKEGAIPQQAREVLPLSTATEVVYTGFISDWSHFFDMRCSNAAHPDMRAIAIPLKDEFVKRNLL